VAHADRWINLPQSLADTKAKLQNGEQADIVVFGDSLSFSTDETTYLTYFRDHLQQQYGDAGHGYQGSSLWSGAGFNQDWYGPVISSDPNDLPHRSLDGLWKSYSPNYGWPDQAYYYPRNQQTQLQYLVQPGGGTFQLRRGFDGPVVATINTDAPTQSVASFDYSLASGETSFTIQPLRDGPYTILGQNVTKPDAGVRVHRAANGGWGINNFLQRDWTFDQQVGLLHPDLFMIWLGQNEGYHSEASYTAALTQFITRLHQDAPQAEVVLIASYDSGGEYLNYVTSAMQTVAIQEGVGFINIHDTAGNYQFFQDNNYLSDGVHFTPAGGAYLGNYLYRSFLTDGASLLPGDANNDGVVDVGDVKIFGAHWMQSSPELEYSMGDFNFDGIVNVDDLGILATHWGSNDSLASALAAAGVTTVPEPATGLLLAVAGIGALGRRRNARKR
jgi:lysophospholipase L1-like esterase